MFSAETTIDDGGGKVNAGMMPVRQSNSSNAKPAAITDRRRTATRVMNGPPCLRLSPLRCYSRGSTRALALRRSLIYAHGPCMTERADRLAAKLRPQPARQSPKIIVPDNRAIPRARPVRFHDLQKTTGTRRHHADPIGEHRGFVKRMRDQENGRARFSPQPQELVAHEQPRLLVQGAERLVEEDEPGLLHERAGNAYALAHAARELCGIDSAKIGESHERDGVVDAGERLVAGDARVFQTER